MSNSSEGAPHPDNTTTLIADSALDLARAEKELVNAALSESKSVQVVGGQQSRGIWMRVYKIG